MNTSTTAKLLSTLILAGTSTFHFAHAQPTVNFKMSTELLIAKCTSTQKADNTTDTNCVQAQDGMKHANLVVPLTSCNKTDDGGTDCTGTNEQSVLVDNVTYKSTVTVTRHAPLEKAPKFEVTASIVDQAPTIDINLAKGTLLDTTILMTNPIVSPSDKNVSYVPLIAIAPTGSQLDEQVNARVLTIQ